MIVDLAGPQGNSFLLLGLAARLAAQLDLVGSPILKEMQEGDHEHLRAVFKKHFGHVMTFINE